MNHGELTGAILNAAYRIHSELYPVLLESAYKACMLNKLDTRFEPYGLPQSSRSARIAA
jgi:hypothetical protein